MKSTLFLMAAMASQAYAWGDETPEELAEDARQENLNINIEDIYLWCLAGLCGAVFIYRIAVQSLKFLRQMVGMNNDKQRYFAVPNKGYAWFKEHILYAPLFRLRHNREFRLSSAIEMGMLPTRFQSMFLTVLVGINVFLCVYKLPWSAAEGTLAPYLRNRTGVLATVNLIPVVLMAGRNNPLITLMGISFDSFNVMHRNFARIVVLEAVAHWLAWWIPNIQEDGAAAFIQSLASNLIMTGFVAVVSFMTLSLHSMSALRHAFYEAFLYIHIGLVAVALAFLYMHLDGFRYQMLVVAAVVLWSSERVMRLLIVFYRNVGSKCTKAVVEALPGDALRVTIQMARPWKFRAGQHAYLYLPSVGLWTSHPFSLAWSEETEQVTDEKGLVISQQDVLSMRKTSVSLIIRRRTGFTDKLYKAAEKGFHGQITVAAALEGPYGAHHSMASYGTAVMFAGGVGITHQVPHVRELVAGYANGTVATRRLTLVWVIQSPEHLEWIRPWMTSILAMENRRDILKILLFVTRPRSTKEIHSPSSTVLMYPGRPNIDSIIETEQQNQIGTMGVSICGTGTMADDIRRATRKRQQYSSIEFIEESFTW